MSGEGSYLFGNRWNRPGTRVVYLASTTSLAALEVLVHAGAPDHLVDFSAIPVLIPQAQVGVLHELPADWQESPAPASAQAVGTAWAETGSSAVLQVPSVIVPWEYNYVVSVEHQAFRELQVGQPRAFRFDGRLQQMA